MEGTQQRLPYKGKHAYAKYWISVSPVGAILHPQKTATLRKSPCTLENLSPLEIHITCQTHLRTDLILWLKNSLQQSAVFSFLIFGRVVWFGSQCPGATQDLDVIIFLWSHKEDYCKSRSSVFYTTCNFACHWVYHAGCASSMFSKDPVEILIAWIQCSCYLLSIF